MGRDLEHTLGRFAAKCEATGMRLRISNSKAMSLNWKKVTGSPQVRGEPLAQVEEFKNLEVMCEGRMEHEIDCSSAVVVSVCHGKERKLLISRRIYTPIQSICIWVYLLYLPYSFQGTTPDIIRQTKAEYKTLAIKACMDCHYQLAGIMDRSNSINFQMESSWSGWYMPPKAEEKVQRQTDRQVMMKQTHKLQGFASSGVSTGVWIKNTFYIQRQLKWSKLQTVLKI